MTHKVKRHSSSTRHVSGSTRAAGSSGSCQKVVFRGLPQDSRADKQAFRESLWLPLQVSPDKYKSIGNGFKVTVREDGMRGLAKGWAPTFIGYSMQGLCKFGFYEVFKIFYSDMLGEVRPAATRRCSRLIWLTSVFLLFFLFLYNRKIL